MDIERAEALLSLVIDPGLPDEIRLEAHQQFLDLFDPADVHRAMQPYLGEFLEAFQRDAVDTTLDPDTRRQANEHAEYLRFRQRMLGG
ncbi:hypothetical protein [Pseudomonas putida]|uniref:hypothetical protein n=1 Tax=Pseudomonas putida TaxID=303 RepID=UPI001ED94F5A|nr:hypothetical protein [Pseudomonas putida]